MHHQSEEYNLTVALRQSWIHSLLAFIFFLPIAFLGVDVLTLGICASINSFFQFWIHTKAIDRMPSNPDSRLANEQRLRRPILRVVPRIHAKRAKAKQSRDSEGHSPECSCGAIPA